MRNKHNKSHKPCRYFPTQNCEYDYECHFTHVILKQNEQICYKCGDILSNKTLLLKHIVSVHGEDPCKKFRVNKCTFGTKCFFKHIIEPGQNVVNSAQTAHGNNTQQVFYSLPTPGQQNLTVGVEDQKMFQMMTMMMSQMMGQMNLNRQ